MGKQKYRCTLFFLLVIVGPFSIFSQTPPTPPTPTGDRGWSAWWYDDSVEDVEAEFNAARRNEENQRNLPTGILGNLVLPADYLSRSFREQAFILINLERQARHNVTYPGLWTATGLVLEGVEPAVNNAAQAHADDMQLNDYFAHNSQDGTKWYTRIANALAAAGLAGCYEGRSENIAWNSVSSPQGFILTIPLSIYNFMYDDGACCNWGHRNLCLKQTGNNNYGDPNKLGVVGFGRAPGTNGDYFVMDYIDPKPGCNYNLEDYSGGSCPDYLTVDGSIYSGTYEAGISIESMGTIMDGENVNYNAGNEIILSANFEAVLGSTLDIGIDDCSTAIIQPSQFPEQKSEFRIITFAPRYLMPLHKQK